MSGQTGRGSLLAVAAALAWAHPATAQPSLDLSVGTSLQSLSSPATAARDTPMTLAGGGAAGLDFAARHGHAGYSLDAGSYASEGDWTYRLHRLDARYRIDLSPGARLNAGATGAVRRNGAAWRDANYDALGAFLNLETTPTPGLTLRTGYRMDRRTFDAMPSLDQTEHGVFASVLANLPSRTTLIAEARAGVKGYRGAAIGASDTSAASPNDAAPGEAAPAEGQRHSRGRDGGSGSMGPGVRPTPPDFPATASDRARQMTLVARVAQSLEDRTGLSIQATWRATGGRVPPAVVTTPAGFFDDGVYDDPFASDLLAADVRLKHIRPGGAVFEAFARRFVQSYTAALALGADGLPLPGEPLREDRVFRAALAVELPLLPSHTGALAARLYLGYGYTRSSSNDAFYDYRNHGVGAAVSLAY
jgi:hypothetical protein